MVVEQEKNLLVKDAFKNMKLEKDWLNEGNNVFLPEEIKNKTMTNHNRNKEANKVLNNVDNF